MLMLRNFLLFLTLLILDQLTKHLAVSGLHLGEPVPVIEGLFNLTRVHNPGAAFGMFGDLPDFWRRVVLGIVSAFALGVVLFYMLNDARGDRLAQFALSGILSGALGNLLDRYRYDYVIDFLDFHWQSYHWPAFNVADSAICIGVTILLFRVLFPRAQENTIPQATNSAKAEQETNSL